MALIHGQPLFQFPQRTGEKLQEDLRYVCTDISQPDTIKRELESIITTARYFRIKENFIVTYNQEQDFHEEGISVKAIPAWKWMLNPVYPFDFYRFILLEFVELIRLIGLIAPVKSAPLISMKPR